MIMLTILIMIMLILKMIMILLSRGPPAADGARRGAVEGFPSGKRERKGSEIMKPCFLYAMYIYIYIYICYIYICIYIYMQHICI